MAIPLRSSASRRHAKFQAIGAASNNRRLPRRCKRVPKISRPPLNTRSYRRRRAHRKSGNQPASTRIAAISENLSSMREAPFLEKGHRGLYIDPPIKGPRCASMIGSDRRADSTRTPSRRSRSCGPHVDEFTHEGTTSLFAALDHAVEQLSISCVGVRLEFLVLTHRQCVGSV